MIFRATSESIEPNPVEPDEEIDERIEKVLEPDASETDGARALPDEIEKDLLMLDLTDRNTSIGNSSRSPHNLPSRDTASKNSIPASKASTIASPVWIHQDFPLDYQMGKLPKYLIEYKEKEVERHKQEALIDRDCPAGHVPVSDEERQITLKTAEEKQLELIAELNRLPMTSTTLRVRNRRIEIERESRELDAVIKTFSKIKVYMKRDTVSSPSQSQ